MNTQGESKWSVTISIHEIELDDIDFQDIDKSQLGYYIHLGKKLFDVLVISEGQNTVKIPLNKNDNDRVVIIAKSIGSDEQKVGSISISQDIILAPGEGDFKQWITLFDHLDDDEYDGEMGENDDEAPRIRVGFNIRKESQGRRTKEKRYGGKSINNSFDKQSQSPLRDQIQSQSEVQPETQMIKKKQYGKTSSGLPIPPSNQIKTNPINYTSNSNPQQATIFSNQPIETSFNEDMDISLELKKQPINRYKIDYLRKLLDEKLKHLIQQLKDKNNDLQVNENDFIERLSVIKSYNSELEDQYQLKSDSTTSVQNQLNQNKTQHKSILEQHNPLSLQEQLLQLEKTLQTLKVEHEQTSYQNDKIQIAKGDRLSKDLNQRVYVDKKPNEKSREYLKEIEEKRQNQRDSERDYNRDIYQLAMDYKRQIQEFENLLVTYSKEINSLNLEIEQLNISINYEKGFFELEKEKESKNNQQIEILKTRIKDLENLIETKKTEGEELYNQLRDQMSFQEDRIKQTKEEIAKLRGLHLQKLEQENQDISNDILNIESQLSKTNNQEQIKKLEIKLDKLKNQRENLRTELEQIQSKLQINVQIDNQEININELESLHLQLQAKDKELLVNLLTEKDKSKLDWLQNWVNQETNDIMRRDKNDIINSIDMYSDDVSKLNKIIDKYQTVQFSQQEKFQAQSDQLKLLDNEMKMLKDERNDCEKELRQLSTNLDKFNTESKTKEQAFQEKERELQQIDGDIDLIEQQIEQMQKVLGNKDEEIQQLEEQIQNLGQSQISSSLYKAMKGDLVDELLAKYINMSQCPVPIKRIGNGYYLFGTKKIFAKIMNGKLVIRVGGGYMVIEEFIATYADVELKRIQSGVSIGQSEDNSVVSRDYGSNKRSPRASPRGETFSKRTQGFK